MKYLSLSALAALTFFVLGSCSKKDDTKPGDKECGEESTSGMTIISADEWDDYPKDGIRSRQMTEYAVASATNNANFSLTIDFDGVCPYSSTDVGMTLSLKKEAPDIEVVATAGELGVDPGVNLTVTKLSPTLYNCYEAYVYHLNDDVNPTKFRGRVNVLFPTKGSWTADSTYFFGELLQNYGLSVHAKLPK